MLQKRLPLLLALGWLIGSTGYSQNQYGLNKTFQGGGADANLLPGANGNTNAGSVFSPDLFNGTANVSIPIYNNGADGISLSYNTAGIKVGETAGTIGLHWNLNIGGSNGSITRVMKDLPDEMNVPTNLVASLMGGGSGGSSGAPAANGLVGKWTQYGLGQAAQSGNNVYLDDESDDFIFSVAGLTFSFNIGSNGFIFTNPQKNIKIELLLNGQAVTTTLNQLPSDATVAMQNITFRVRDAQGNWYYFQKGDVTHMAYGDPTSPDLEYDYISRWVIQKIVRNDGLQTNFQYVTRTPTSNLIYRSFSGYEQNNLSTGSPVITSSDVTAKQGLSSYSDLLSIQYPNNVTASFVYQSPALPDGRCDDPGNVIMTEIQLQSQGTGIRYIFDQNYALSPKGSLALPTEIPLGSCKDIDAVPNQYNHNYWYHRLILKGIRIMSMDGAKSDPYYAFEYNTSQRLPFKLSGAQDYFGYYNGKDLIDSYGGMFTIPRHTTKISAGTPQTYGVDKTDNWLYAISDILTVVQNAYGGKTQFEYEGHSLSNVLSDAGITLPSDPYFFGATANDGARLKFVMTSDARYPGKYQKQSFTYSGGQRFMPGGYFDYPLYTIDPGASWVGNISPNTSFSGTFVSPHQFINGSNHGYSSVVTTTTNETGQQLSRQEQTFQNISRGAGNTSYYSTGTKKYFELPYTDKQYIKEWEIGVPLTATQYDKDNNIVSKTTNVYAPKEDFSSAIGKVENIKRLSTSENSLLTTYASDAYRPYTGMYMLIQTTTQKFVDDNTSINDVVTYGYDTRNNLTSTITQNSRGENFSLKNIYNYTVSGPGVAYGGSSGTLYTMTNDGLELNVSTELWKLGTSNLPLTNQLMEANITRYKYQNGLLATQKQYSLQTLNPIGYTAYTGISTNPATSSAFGNILNVYDTTYTQPIPNFQVASEVLQFDAKLNPTEVQLKGQNSYMAMIWDAANGNKLVDVQNARLADIGYTSFERLEGVGYSGSETSTDGGFTYNQWGSVDNFSTMSGSRAFRLIPSGVTQNYYINTPVLTSNKPYVMTFWCNGAVPSIKDANGLVLNATLQYTLANNWKNYKVEFSPSVTGIVRFTTNTATYLDELRLFPAGAVMKSNAFAPFVGLTSSTDASARITYYEYDALGRLVDTKDQDGNVISKNEFRIGQ